ncbi:MAG: HAMP domain-containing sensor histidine kinase [Firmicutes bacterium]|nr:HAMP domain-containing sensor histidine kinase [Bacillota bacterium]
MTKKIFVSILTVTLIVLVASFAIILACMYGYFADEQKSSLNHQFTVVAAAVDKEGWDYMKKIDIDDYRYTLIDKNGNVLEDTFAKASTLENHGDREEVKEAFETGKGASTRFSSTLTEKTDYIAKKLSDGTVIRVAATHLTILSYILVMLQPMCVVLIIAIIAAALMARRAAVKIVKNINEISFEDTDDDSVFKELGPMIEHSGKHTGQKMRKEFTANVSHELKTPLQTIMGSAELLEAGAVKEEDVPQFANRIRKESTNLLNLVDDIISLSKLDEKEPLPKEEVNMAETAKDVADSLEEVASAGQVKLELEISGEKYLTVNSVYQLVREIMYNLCDNGIKYNNPGGSVILSVCGSPDSVTIKVRDTGIGIEEEHLDRIFERFYRVDKSHSKATGGTGLGLSIVKNAVAFLDGEIHTISALGVGTEITVILPKQR